MARFRELPAVDSVLRVELAAHFRAAAARSLPFDAVHHPYCEPWSQLAYRLEAGEAVELPGWQVGRRIPGRNFTPVHRVIVEPDGTVTPLPNPQSKVI